MDANETGLHESRPWGPETQSRYTENAIRRAPEDCQAALREFAQWLEEVRGLAQGSVTLRVSSARRFAEWLYAKEQPFKAALSGLSAGRVEDFFVSFCSEHGPASRRSMQAALRLFLCFAARRAWCAELEAAVPSMRTYGLNRVSRGLDEQQVRRLLASLDDERSSARDRAIIRMLATYGLRRGQVSALDLGDIDWRARSVTFAPHKGGLAVSHVLTPRVADSVAHYLREQRPTVDEAAVFLRSRPPYGRLSPTAVTGVVATCLKRAGIRCVPASPHALRHAFATRLLRSGQSFKTIADLLGHRSLATTAMYAKVDFKSMSELAVPWPEVAP